MLGPEIEDNDEEDETSSSLVKVTSCAGVQMKKKKERLGTKKRSIWRTTHQ